MTDAKAPPFRSEEQDWRTHLYNQERIINLQGEMLDLQKQLIAAMDRMASPERVHGVVVAMKEMVEKMDGAGSQLHLAVDKLSSAFWGLMKVPVAVVVVGAASWAFLYEGKISERTWLIMLAVAVFPWLGDSLTAIGALFGVGKGTRTNNGKQN